MSTTRTTRPATTKAVPVVGVPIATSAATPEVIATTKAQRWDPAEVLRAMFTEEAAGRE